MKAFCLPLSFACLLTLAAPPMRAQSIPNPGFEADSFTVWPGYASGNGGVITGWSFTGGAGLNPASANPFADNGAIPQGTNIAFIQSGGNVSGSLSTTITGLITGDVYRLRFRANSRSGYAPPAPGFSLDGRPLVTFAASPAVGALNDYYYVTGIFTASASTAALLIINHTFDDSTLLVDDFSIGRETTSGWAVSAWTGDATSGLSPRTRWARRFGTDQGTRINSADVNGVDGPNPAVPDMFAITGVPEIFTGDENNLTALSDTGSAEMAGNFLFGGSPGTLTLKGLTPGHTYVASLFSVGWDPNVPRHVTFSSGGQQQVVDQNQFGDNNGLRVDFTFVANAVTHVITFAPVVPGYTFHLYGVALTEPLLVSNNADSGPGSLRNTIATAASLPGPDFIAFAPGLSGQTITFGSRIILNDAAGIVIDATTLAAGLTLGNSGGHQHFEMPADANCALRGLTMIDGAGGAGGAILNYGTLDLMHCTFTNNSGEQGGAIRTYGTLTLTDCIFSGNHASGHGGAINHTTFGNLTLTRCTFSGNSAYAAGAIYHWHSIFTMSHCTFSGNSATTRGGAIGGEWAGVAGGRWTFTHCTLSGNSAGERAGGIWAVNNLISMTLTNCIVAGNSAPTGGDIEFFGDLIRAGANIIGPVTNSGTGSASGPAAITLDPLLAPLANYGGFTETMALRPGSPARNASANSPFVSDQRGFPISYTIPDIGAYEAGNLANCATYFAETYPPTAPAASVGPAGDFDGDGSSNEQEWNAQTDPANPASFFRILSSVRIGANMDITFPSLGGRRYTLWRADSPAGPWTNTGLTRVDGDGTNRTFSIPAPVAGTPGRFFRVMARP